jgi:RNA polymerase sigma factor (sigma-70 family)
MGDEDWLARRFEEHRPHLRAVAGRILGSAADPDEAVRETWLRLRRADTSHVENLAGWLTTTVARICLDVLLSRRSHPDETTEDQPSEPRPGQHERPDQHERPGQNEPIEEQDQTLLADSMGPALLAVVETLAPAERIAFVLHDMFAVPFDEIALILGRSVADARQLASRARRRVRGGAVPETDVGRQRQVIDVFLAASRTGDFEALLAVLDPEVVLRGDTAVVRLGAAGELRGAPTVANTFAGRAQAAVSALVDGRAGAVWAVGGRPRVVFTFTVAAGRIVAIEMLADADRLRDLDIVMTNS